MSDANHREKLIEEQHLSCFLQAYRTVTGTTLTIASGGGSPDFICARLCGELIGVEMTPSPHNNERAVDDRIWGDRSMESYDLLEAIGGMITTKERKRESPHWRTPNNTILIVELLDDGFDSLLWTEDSSISDEYPDTSFIEIWTADHSTLEAFGEVWLIGLYPAHFWGLPPQPAIERKHHG